MQTTININQPRLILPIKHVVPDCRTAFVPILLLVLGSNAIPLSAQKLAPPSPAFRAIAPQLETGGGVFFLMSAEQVRKRIASFADLVRKAAPAAKRNNVELGLKMSSRFSRSTGLSNLLGYGSSSRPFSQGLYSHRQVLEAEADRARGLLWEFFSPNPAAPESLSMLPAETAVASVGEFQFVRIFNWLDHMISDTSIEADYRAALAEIQKTFPLKELLESMGEDVGLGLTLDPENMHEIEAEEGLTLRLPDPGGFLLVKTKNTMLLDLITGLLGMSGAPIAVREFGDLKGWSLTLPPIPDVPFRIRPCLIQSGDYLLVTSSPKLMRKLLNRQKGQGASLLEHEAFAEMKLGELTRANRVTLVAPSLPQVYNSLTAQAFDAALVEARKEAEPGLEEFVEMFRSMYDSAQPFYQVSTWRRTDSGLFAQAISTRPGVETMNLTGVAVVAILASIVVPAVTTTLDAAKHTKAQSNGRNLFIIMFDQALTGEKPGFASVGAYQTSTAYLQDLLETAEAPLTLAGGPGLPEILPGDKLTAEKNFWSVVEGVKDGDPAGLPVLISRNLGLKSLNDPQFEEKVWQAEGIVILITHGGGARNYRPNQREALLRDLKPWRNHKHKILHP